MSKLSLFLITALVVLLAGFGYAAKKAFHYYKISQAQTSKLMKANLDIGRANTKLSDAKTMISKLNKQIQKEIKDRDATLQLYMSLQAKYNKEVKNRPVKTVVVTDTKTIDLPKGKIYLRTDQGYKEINSMKWSYSDFRITITGDAVQETLSYKLHQKFRGSIAETRLPSGGYNHYVEIHEIDDKGKDVGQVKLTKLEAVKTDNLKPRLFLFNPKLDLELGYGITTGLKSSWIGTVGLSIGGYGITKNDLSWRFLRISIGGSRDSLIITGSPVLFNIGSALPLVSNLWIGPAVGYDFSSRAAIFTFGLSVGL